MLYVQCTGELSLSCDCVRQCCQIMGECQKLSRMSVQIALMRGATYYECIKAMQDGVTCMTNPICLLKRLFSFWPLNVTAPVLRIALHAEDNTSEVAVCSKTKPSDMEHSLDCCSALHQCCCFCSTATKLKQCKECVHGLHDRWPTFEHVTQ